MLSYEKGCRCICCLPQCHISVTVTGAEFVALQTESDAINLGKDSRRTHCLDRLHMRPLPQLDRSILTTSNVWKQTIKMSLQKILFSYRVIVVVNIFLNMFTKLGSLLNTLFEKSNFCPKIQFWPFWQNSNIFTRFFFFFW